MGAVHNERSPLARAVTKFGSWFEDRGLRPADLPMAVVVHEVCKIKDLMWYHLIPDSQMMHSQHRLLG